MKTIKRSFITAIALLLAALMAATAAPLAFAAGTTTTAPAKTVPNMTVTTDADGNICFGVNYRITNSATSKSKFQEKVSGVWTDRRGGLIKAVGPNELRTNTKLVSLLPANTWLIFASFDDSSGAFFIG